LWGDLDRQQTDQLRNLNPWTYDGVAVLLQSWTLPQDTTTPEGEILTKFYFGNLRFAVENKFSTEKTSTLFSVLKLAHFISMERCLGADQSIQELQTLLVKHSVERPPHSIGIFSAEDIRKIMDFVADTYYRHYKLYRFIFTKRRVLDFSIKPNTIEYPTEMKPLSEATPEADIREPDVDQVAQEEPKVLTEEEQAAEAEQQDEDLLNNPNTELVQKLVAKKLETVKEQVEKDFADTEAAYKARIAELEAKLAAQ